MILPGQLALIAILGLVGATLTTWGFRRDRVLGILVLTSLVVSLLLLLASVLYLHHWRGRTYLSPDEVAYLSEARRWLQQGGHGAPFRSAISGGYVYWNAAVLWFWQTSALGVKLVNVVLGAAGVLVAYSLAERLFDRGAARMAAVLAVFSPTLLVWSLANLKERPLGVLLCGSSLAGVIALRHWGWPTLGAFSGVVVVLGWIRHYYAPIVGWVFLIMLSVWPNLRWSERTRRVCIGLLVVGAALWIATGSFLAVGMRHETVRRYVASEFESPDDIERALEFGGTAGRGERVVMGLRAAAVGVPHVLFDRFEPRGSVGTVMHWILLPDWLLSFLFVPLAVVGTIRASSRGRPEALLVAGITAGVVLILALAYGDAWTTIRLRAIYWPLVLVLASDPLARMFDMYSRRTPAFRTSGDTRS